MIRGFMRQTCTWKAQTGEYDDLGAPGYGDPVSIPCRWVPKDVQADLPMSPNDPAGLRWSHKVLVSSCVMVGDILVWDGAEHTALAREGIVGLGGNLMGYWVWC